jgi:hypothetical protein
VRFDWSVIVLYLEEEEEEEEVTCSRYDIAEKMLIS